MAFRYLVPEQPSLNQVNIANELTEFAYVKDATTYPLIWTDTKLSGKTSTGSGM